MLTLAIETALLYLLLCKKYPTLLIAKNAAIANLITLPFVWFVFPALSLSWALHTAAAELFAFFTEAGVYRLLFKKIGWKKAILASLACNLLSFVAWLIL